MNTSNKNDIATSHYGMIPRVVYKELFKPPNLVKEDFHSPVST